MGLYQFMAIFIFGVLCMAIVMLLDEEWMYIFRVTDTVTNKEVFTGNTNEVVERFCIASNSLYYFAKTKQVYGGYTFTKIGTDGKKKEKRELVDKTATKTNKGLDEDLKQARLLGLEYGEYKKLYYWGT